MADTMTDRCESALKTLSKHRGNWWYYTTGYVQPRDSTAPNERRQCTLCGGLCNTYHIIECTRRTLTLSHYANDTNFQWFMIYTLYTMSLLNPLLLRKRGCVAFGDWNLFKLFIERLTRLLHSITASVERQFVSLWTENNIYGHYGWNSK